MSTVRHILLGILGVALVAIWGASAAGNFAHGVQLSGSSPWWPVIGAASAASDVAKAWSLLGFAAAWHKRAAAAMMATAMIWLVTTLWGVIACTGFISTLLTDTASGRAMHGVADTSLHRQIDDQVSQVTKLQDFKLRAPARDWERIEGEIQRTESRLEGLRQRARVTPTVGAAEPFAALLLKRWGVDEDTFRLGKTVIFLLMVEICASMGFVAFAPLFGAKHEEIAEQITAVPETKPAKPKKPGSKPGKVVQLKAVKTSDWRLQTLELLAELEKAHKPGTAIETDIVYNLHVALAKKGNYKAMTSKILGHQLHYVDVTKDGPDALKRTFYVLPTRKGGVGSAR